MDSFNPALRCRRFRSSCSVVIFAPCLADFVTPVPVAAFAFQPTPYYARRLLDAVINFGGYPA
jgi:hypothetical protein